jgi:hypothetical protein
MSLLVPPGFDAVADHQHYSFRMPFIDNDED